MFNLFLFLFFYILFKHINHTKLPQLNEITLICVYRHALSSVHFLHHILCLFVFLIMLISLKCCFTTLLNN